MKFLTSATRAKLIILTLLLGSCATVQQQAFDLSQYQQLSGKTIGIVQVAAPAAESHYSGQI
ncbi:MAG: hypothetical protein OIF35_08220, partial [Cellvibrionaceae bacterium]|nr:hypothetical protein [Cellvibrionaceae bacterium]